MNPDDLNKLKGLTRDQIMELMKPIMAECEKLGIGGAPLIVKILDLMEDNKANTITDWLFALAATLQIMLSIPTDHPSPRYVQQLSDQLTGFTARIFLIQAAWKDAEKAGHN